MFKKSQRFSFKNRLPAKRLDTKYFSLRYQQSEDNLFHAAVVVSKKVSKSSVLRHKLKRNFINSVKDFIKDKNFGYNLIFYLKGDILNIDFKEVDQKINEVLNSLN